MSAYVAWANTHEADGWQFGFGEQWQERLLSWEGGSIKLVGQIDRIDVREDGERLVLDYKSSKKTSSITVSRHWKIISCLLWFAA